MALLLASALFQCSNDRRPQRLVYQQFFPNTRCCEVDLLHEPDQPLVGGRGWAGERNYYWSPSSGMLTFIAPDPIEKPSPSVGAFSTTEAYGPNSSFTIKAAFQNPIGPHLAAENNGPTNAWSVGLVARTGDEDDLATLPRLTVTLRVRNKTAFLNVQGVDPKPDPQPISAAMYEWIFDMKRTFSMELYVDRASGTGKATLQGDGNLEIPFNLPKAGSTITDPSPILPDVPITVLGATLTNCCSRGQQTTVELRDFEIWAE
jgi:hypothetical protein